MFPLNHVHSSLVETEHFIHYKESNFVHLSYTLVFIMLGKEKAFSLAEYITNLMDVACETTLCSLFILYFIVLLKQITLYIIRGLIICICCIP